jgi:O-antigen/teichoic acid export membrane protein
VIQVPQRSLVSASIPVLSRAWKDKDFDTLDRIYKRSSLNLLLVSVFIFSLIFLNYDNGVAALHLKPEFAMGKWVVFLLGIKNIVDMGTGVNGQIIGTSVYWRCDFLSGVILLILIIPLNIFLVKEFGIVGAAWSNLVAYIIYNILRIVFLQMKFKLQPFTMQTVYVLAHSVTCFALTYFLFRGLAGWTGIIVGSTAFVSLFTISAYLLRLSPDIIPLIESIKMRLRRRG